MGNPDYPAIERILLEKKYLEVLSEEYLFIPTERTSLVKMTWDKESAFQSDFSVRDVVYLIIGLKGNSLIQLDIFHWKCAFEQKVWIF